MQIVWLLAGCHSERIEKKCSRDRDIYLADFGLFTATYVNSEYELSADIVNKNWRAGVFQGIGVGGDQTSVVLEGFLDHHGLMSFFGDSLGNTLIEPDNRIASTVYYCAACMENMRVRNGAWIGSWEIYNSVEGDDVWDNPWDDIFPYGKVYFEVETNEIVSAPIFWKPRIIASHTGSLESIVLQEISESGERTSLGKLSDLCDYSAVTDTIAALPPLSYAYFQVFDPGKSGKRLMRIVVSESRLYNSNEVKYRGKYVAGWPNRQNVEDAVVLTIEFDRTSLAGCRANSVQKNNTYDSLVMPGYESSLDMDSSVSGALVHHEAGLFSDTDNAYYLALTTGTWQINSGTIPRALFSLNAVETISASPSGQSIMFLVNGMLCHRNSDEINCLNSRKEVDSSTVYDTGCKGYYCLYEGILSPSNDYVMNISRVIDRSELVNSMIEKIIDYRDANCEARE